MGKLWAFGAWDKQLKALGYFQRTEITHEKILPRRGHSYKVGSEK